MAQPGPSAVLIFPGGYGDGPAYRGRSTAQGMRVVGASSIEADPERERYRQWTFLPHVSDDRFDAALAEVVARFGIDQIHATHLVVWTRLKATLPKVAPGVLLTLGRTNLDVEAEYRELRRRVAEAPEIAALLAASTPRTAPSPIEIAGFLRASLSIPGESYEEKLLAMVEVARRTPAGDVVEIGSLFGRTAAFLALLSRHYCLGALLCIDPWSREEINQGSAILQATSKDYRWDEWRLAFEINVAPFASGNLNYIHATSAAAEKIYAAARQVDTAAFGQTSYEGRVAILHIDGNHEYTHAREDVELWVPKVVAGGWIILDDYEWDWGDGPRRAGDALLRDAAGHIRCHFVHGGALFVQMKG